MNKKSFLLSNACLFSCCLLRFLRDPPRLSARKRRSFGLFASFDFFSQETGAVVSKAGVNRMYCSTHTPRQIPVGPYVRCRIHPPIQKIFNRAFRTDDQTIENQFLKVLHLLPHQKILSFARQAFRRRC